MKRLFWHLVAMVMCCDFSHPDTVTDGEYEAYKRYMRKRGCP